MIAAPLRSRAAAAAAIGVAFAGGILTGSSATDRPSSPGSPPPSAVVTSAPSIGPAASTTPPPAVLPAPTTTAAAPPGPLRTSDRSSGTAPAPAGEQSPAGPQIADMDDLLRQDGRPPADVAAQLGVFLDGGGVDCSPQEPSDRPAVFAPEYLRVPSLLVACVPEFDAGRALTYAVTDPAGTSRTVTLRPGWDPSRDVLYALPPGSPTGRYRIHVSQGSSVASTTFQVRLATKPTIWVHPNTATAGATIGVWVGGFPPGQPADLHVYACDNPTRYRATVTVAVNGHGAAHLKLRTSARTPATCYIVISPMVHDTLTEALLPLPLHSDVQLMPPPR